MRDDIRDLVNGDYYRGKTAVVTGGAGFIGSHLVESLQMVGANVLVIDNRSRGRNASRSSVELDLARQSDCIGLGKLFRNNVVFHLAAKVANIEFNRLNQWEMFDANLAINANVVRAAKECSPEKFVYVSTSCVYSHDVPVPTPESAAEIIDPEPTNYGYGLAKHVGEKAVQLAHAETDLPCAIVRFFNAFGLRDYYDYETSHVAPALIRRFVDEEDPVTVWGSGNQTRVLVDAEDLAVALLIVAEKCSTPNPVNLGHDREVSIGDLASLIRELTGSKAKIVFDQTKPEGYLRRCADVTRFKELSGGWTPDTPLEETLRKMIEEYRNGLSV